MAITALCVPVTRPLLVLLGGELRTVSSVTMTEEVDCALASALCLATRGALTCVLQSVLELALELPTELYGEFSGSRFEFDDCRLAERLQPGPEDLTFSPHTWTCARSCGRYT